MKLQRKITNNILIDKETKCWNWQKCCRNGYGLLRWSGKTQSAHRLAYKAFIGEIPNNMHVLHTCDRPGCCNPEHLWVGTHAENMKDKMKKGRWNGGGPKGEKHYKAKLTEQQVREILESDKAQKILAEKHGVTSSAVSSIKTGKNWGYLQIVGEQNALIRN